METIDGYGSLRYLEVRFSKGKFVLSQTPKQQQDEELCKALKLQIGLIFLKIESLTSVPACGPSISKPVVQFFKFHLNSVLGMHLSTQLRE